MPTALARRAPRFQPLAPDPVEIEAPIEDFRAFTRKTQPEIVSPQFAHTVRNIRFSETLGSLVKRASRAKFGGMASLGTSKITFMVRYYKSSSGGKKLVIAFSTTLKVGDDEAGTFTNIKTGMTADQIYTSITYKNLLYLFNGTDTTQVFDLAQSATEDIGVPTPGAPTVATGAAGALTGNYQYKITYEIDSYQEGNAGTASAVVAPSSQKVELSAIPTSANTRVTARNIYRTEAGGTVYYFLARIADNTTTTYSDNTADGSLTTTRTAPSDYGAPDQNYRFSVLHKGRIFQLRGETDKSKGIFSDIRSGTAYPDVYPANNAFFVTRDDGEEITHAGEDNFGQFIAMKSNAIVKINTDGDSPTSWSGFNDVLSKDGCLCPWSAQKTFAGIMYVGTSGEAKRRLLLWNGSRVESLFPELDPILSEAARSKNDEFVSAYRDGLYYLAFPDATSTINNQVLIVDLVNKVWTLDDKNVQSFSVWSSRNDFSELYTGTSDTTGFVYREDTSVEDVLVQTGSELDEGTYEQCEKGGTDASPTVVLIQAQLVDDIGAKVISAATETISDLTDTLTETVAPSGRYTSKVFEVNAVTLGSIFWNETLGSFGEVLTRVRVGDTLAEIAAASYSSDFTNPSGSSLAAVTAKKYIQFQAQLYVTQADATVSEAPNVYLSRGSAPSDYVFKITLGQGELAETAIEMEYESHWLDFAWVNPTLKNRIKHFHAVKVEFERSLATGSLTFGWRKDGESSVLRRDTSFTFSTYASQGFFVLRFPITGSNVCYAKRLKYRLYHEDDTSALTIRRVTFMFTVEPYRQSF